MSHSGDLEAHGRPLSGDALLGHDGPDFGMAPHHASVSDGHGATASMLPNDRPGVSPLLTSYDLNTPGVDRSTEGGAPSLHAYSRHPGASSTFAHRATAGAPSQAPFPPVPDRIVPHNQGGYSNQMRGVPPHHPHDQQGYPLDPRNTSAPQVGNPYPPGYRTPSSSYRTSGGVISPWAAAFDSGATAATQRHQNIFPGPPDF